MSDPTWVTLGRAVRAHGVRGELRIQPDPPEARDLLTPGRVLRATLRTGVTRQLTVGPQVRQIHDAVLVTLEELADREEVQTLAGATLEVRAAELPSDDEQPYLFELEGAAVVDEAGTFYGRAVHVADNGGQELLVIEGPEGQELLLPLVEETFLGLERDPHRLLIRPIDGLWDDVS